MSEVIKDRHSDPQSGDSEQRQSPFAVTLPASASSPGRWGRLYGCSTGLVISQAAVRHDGPVIVITADMPSAERLEDEVRFFTADDTRILTFPDRETLPYDNFSPHQDIVSQRLDTLYRLPSLHDGILLVPVATVMCRLPPHHYLDGDCLILDRGQKLEIESFRLRLEQSGYRYVAQVMEHGEFSVRGGLIDLFPMGSNYPLRIDLFDEEIDSIRTFDPETQRSDKNIDSFRLIAAREFPLHETAITRFRQNWRSRFAGDPQQCSIYRDVSNGLAPAGIEYYLPLFFEQTTDFFAYLPDNALILVDKDTDAAASRFELEINERYEQRRYDIERPILEPAEVFIPASETLGNLTRFRHCQLFHFGLEAASDAINVATRPLPAVATTPHSKQPLLALQQFIDGFDGRILFIAESGGRRESLLQLLRDLHCYPSEFKSWREFVAAEARYGICISQINQGAIFDDPAVAIITEAQILGAQVMQRRRRKRRERDADALIKNLTELEIGAPVVHEEHGVGRYQGLQTIDVGGMTTEFLTLLYADDARLYVPVASLHLISRYTGAAGDMAPLHRLGSDQWQRARRKAAEQVRDVAAELLDIYARREARQGHVFKLSEDQYAAFATAFPFEETPDQQQSIDDIRNDMLSPRPMDRLVCGDVGFGKTEVAMRAAFIAVNDGKQVAVLVPTTLLAQQHFQNFQDRFADLPVRIEVLSRFNTGAKLNRTLDDIASGKIDIVIGTHKLLQDSVKFKQLGIVIIDEEHRFGVRQKERFKALRAEVDVLTLTATPIPRTLNMAMSGLRDLSIIATPPLHRLTIKTFVREWNDALVREAVLREIRRGGQVYFLHNEVKSIEKTARQIETLIPEASVRFAHGQMREMELERIMSDFYHQRFNILVSTTIIESGIDVPNANTIIINRADKLGLAQLYQIRGRVGRSHHQAYAYLIIPPRKLMTADAVKRLEAIEAIQDLGAGFTLATHDLEIRGAGELLGDEQSGQIHEIGFTMYAELLERAVTALKAGKQPELDQPLSLSAEVDLRIPALLPADYLPDVHTRLVMYKRIASAGSQDDLDEIQVEMIDRFGLLPDATKNLIALTELKLFAQPYGVRKIEAGGQDGHILFTDQPNIDPGKLIELIQKQRLIYKFDGKNKLSFKLNDDDTKKRIEFIKAMLVKLKKD